MTVRNSVLLVGIALVLVGASTARADPQGYVWMDYLSYTGDSSVMITANADIPDTYDMWGLQGSGLGFGKFKFDVTGFGNGGSPAYPALELEGYIADAVGFVSGSLGDAQQHLLYGYCIDSGQYVDPLNNNYEIRPLEDIFTLKGVDGTTAQNRANDLRRLYGGYLTSVDTTLEMAAFAAATWEVVYEDSGNYGLGTGDFRLADDGFTATATSYLNGLASKPLDNRVYALYDPANQDFAVVIPGSALPPVPEPFTMATAFLAIGSFGMYIRKHTRKGLPGPALS